MINYYALSPDFTQSEVTDESSANWIQVVQPTQDEINQLAESNHFPIDYLTSILDSQELSRFEVAKQTDDPPVLVLVQHPKAIQNVSGYSQYTTPPLSIVITKEKIITTTNETTNNLKTMDYHWKTDPSIPIHEHFALHILWSIALQYVKDVTVLKKRTEDLEQKLRISTENDQLFQLMAIQKSLIYLESALKDNLKVIDHMLATSLIMTSKKSDAYLHDIWVEHNQALSMCQIQKEIVSQISATFSSIVSNNLNIIMKILTSITIVLTIPSIIGGIYGMNVKIPFTDSPIAFWLILLGSTALCLFTIWWLKKNRFL